jgi:hypothetical protein
MATPTLAMAKAVALWPFRAALNLVQHVASVFERRIGTLAAVSVFYFAAAMLKWLPPTWPKFGLMDMVWFLTICALARVTISGVGLSK